jgi:hypothetical protein
MSVVCLFEKRRFSRVIKKPAVLVFQAGNFMQKSARSISLNSIFAGI